MVIRDDRDSIFSLGIFLNKFLLGAVLLTVALQLLVIYLPACNAIFRTEALTLIELGFCLLLLLPLLVIVAVELEKWSRRRGWIQRH